MCVVEKPVYVSQYKELCLVMAFDWSHCKTPNEKCVALKAAVCSVRDKCHLKAMKSNATKNTWQHLS